VPQQLIRESRLAEFLPPVEVEKDDQGKYGRFHLEQGRRELLSQSKPLDGRRIRRDQLERLERAVKEFKAKAWEPGAQPHNRELIERFRLPNPSLEPELYRLVGSWWNRRLQIVWGCERTRDSSLPLNAAVERLPVDRSYHLRRALAALLLLLLVLLPSWWAATNWDQVKGWMAQVIQPPFAGPSNPSPEQQAAADAEKAREAAKQAEAAAQKAQTDAEKAAADAQRAQQAADGTKADVDRKQKEAADALAAAKKADEVAKQARAAAERAIDAALEAEKAADKAKLAKPSGQQQPAKNPAGASPSPGQPSSPLSGTPPLPSPRAGTAAPPSGGHTPPSTQPTPPPNAGAQAQIVLRDQGQPGTDGTMTVTLEVRPLAGPPRALPVQAWTCDGNAVTATDRLQANLKSGDHLITATVVDAAGKVGEIQAVLTIEPGKVITTPGSVSLRPKAAR
jgi:hypothetical protein